MARDWRNLDYVHVRSNLGHVAHVLKMRHYQASLDRLQMRHLPLADFLYITNRIYLSQPSSRLKVLKSDHLLGVVPLPAPAESVLSVPMFRPAGVTQP